MNTADKWVAAASRCHDVCLLAGHSLVDMRAHISQQDGCLKRNSYLHFCLLQSLVDRLDDRVEIRDYSRSEAESPEKEISKEAL